MSRLIDVDALIDYLGFDNTEEEEKKNIGEIVTLDDFDKQPTVFDVDKVVEQLEWLYITKLVGRNFALYQTVMQIVKGGGVE